MKKTRDEVEDWLDEQRSGPLMKTSVQEDHFRLYELGYADAESPPLDKILESYETGYADAKAFITIPKEESKASLSEAQLSLLAGIYRDAYLVNRSHSGDAANALTQAKLAAEGFLGFINGGQQ